ncbi:hypothetical protein PAMP_024567 [Pampus punctatissimus]
MEVDKYLHWRRMDEEEEASQIQKAASCLRERREEERRGEKGREERRGERKIVREGQRGGGRGGGGD